jgi:AcrR family transcriptional regulator
MKQAETSRRRGRPSAGGREAILRAAIELLRERGVARLTTREVASRAGVSEASVFYHYGDRIRLLTAVFEEGVRPLQAIDGRIDGPSVRETLTRFAPALEQFLDRALPVINAAQSDGNLRAALEKYMREHDLGPHRGVAALARYLAKEQAAGRIRDDVDPEAAAFMFIGTVFTRASQRQMPGQQAELPSMAQSIDAFASLLTR